jgi:TP901 family phage tail tape measure protein
VARASTIDVVIKGEYNDRDINRAIADLKKVQAAGLSTGARMQEFGGKMQDMGRSVARVGKSMTVGLTLPIVGAGIAATKMAMDFDDSLTKIVSLVGLSRDEVDGMRGDIIRMASQYGKSGKEAADAMFFITSAGLRGADAMEALEASLKGAAVGLGDVQTIADLATSAVNAYGSDVLGASQATDVLAAAVREGKLEASELSGAMGQVLPIASAMGVGFDEVGAAMAAMSRTGTGAAQASTQLRSIMTGILKPTKQAEKALEGMGLSSEGLRKQLKEQGLLATLQTLSERFDGNDAAAASVFGNVRALAGVMDLMGANAATTEEIFGNMVDTTGMLDEAFATTAETTGFKLRKAFAEMKNSLIEFGDVIAPFVARFAESMSRLAQSFQNLSPQTKETIVRFAAIAAAIGPVLLIVGKLMVAIGGIIKVIGLLVAAFNPVTLVLAAVVAGIALLVGAFTLAWRNSEPLRKAVQELWGTLQTLGRVIMDTVVGAFRTLMGQGNSTGSVLQTIGRIAGQVLTPVIRTVTTVVRALGAAFQVAGKIFEVQITVLRMIGNVVRAVVIAAIDILMNKLGPLSRSFRSMASGLQSAFRIVANAAVILFNNAGKILEGFVNRAISVVNAIIDGYNKVARVVGGMSEVARIAEFRLTSMAAAQSQNTTATYNAASATGANIREMERANPAAANLTDQLGDLSGGFDNVAGGASSAGGATKGAGEESEKASKKIEKFKNAFTEFADKLKKAREDIERDYTAMAQTVSGAVMGILDFGAAAPEVGEDGERVGLSFIEKLQAQAEKAVEFAARIRQLIAAGLSPEALQMVLSAGVDAGTRIADELIGGGQTYIDETNRLVVATQTAANEIGTEAAESFFGAGLALAKQTENAFAKRFGPGGPGYNKLNRLMNHIAKSMERTTTVTVVTRHVSEGIPGRRMGGPVAAGSPYIVGEAGPELFVPTLPGRIVPNHDITGSMTGRGGGVSMASGGSVINLTVNAGMGTQGAEVGRQIVDALKSYERRNGAVYVAA